MEEMNMEAPVGSIEAKDPFAVAPPGHSLTQDNSRWAWGKPPQITDPEEALEVAISSLQRPKVRDEMFKLLYTGVSVEVMVEGYVLQAFHDGKFMPDVGLLIQPPLGMYIAHMAEEAGIPYRLFENEDAGTEGQMDDKTFFSMMRDNNPRMFEFIRENVNESIRQGNMPSEPREENFMTMDMPSEGMEMDDSPEEERIETEEEATI